MTLDEALERLGAALDGAGVPRWSAPASVEAIDEIEREISPLRLPGDVREFWELVDVATLRFWGPTPKFCPPEFALSSWRDARDQFSDMYPLALLNIGYQSHANLSVELASGVHPGGALFEYFLDPGPFRRTHEDLPALLTHIAGRISIGDCERSDPESGPFLLLRSGPWDPSRDESRDVAHDILDWPAHWQQANGVNAESTALRGATHSIADLLAAPVDRPCRATIAAQVADLAGGAGWLRLLLDDGTGRLTVFCPAAALVVAPRGREWCEVDLVITPGADLSGGLLDTPGAMAEGVRRLPGPP